MEATGTRIGREKEKEPERIKGTEMERPRTRTTKKRDTNYSPSHRSLPKALHGNGCSVSAFGGTEIGLNFWNAYRSNHGSHRWAR